MKKLLCIVLSLIMAFGSLSVCSFAFEDKGDISEYPVILVPGYSGSQLDLVKEDGTKERVWGFTAEDIISRILKRITDLGKNLIDTAHGNGERLGKTVGEEMVDLLGVLACNPDGSSVNNIEIVAKEASVSNMAYLHGYDEGLIGEPDLFAEIESLAGAENCYFFTEDWRMTVLECAKRLDEFIQDVKAVSGKDKVNLIAVSHGGQVTSAYLSLYGYKKDVDNAVLTVPAAGGAALAYDIMSETIKLDTYTLVYFLEHGFVTELEFKWLTQALDLGFLDDVIQGLLPYVKQVIGNFGSIWDFIPAEYYDELKDKFLDPELNAKIIENSDKVHYEIMNGYNEAFTKCIEEYGMNVSIIAGTGNPSVTGLQENSDAIITANDSTGATCAPYGKRFSDGYCTANTVCADLTHNHLSPSMEVDASTAYLPENTWFVDQLFHGMTFLDEYSRNLAITLLLTDRITDVYSDPAYPQFHASENSSNTVYAYFKNNSDGYVGSDYDTLVIKNLSKDHALRITAVNIEGADLTPASFGFPAVEPGEEIEIAVTGTLPEVSGKLLQVNIDFYEDGNILLPIGNRVFDFTVLNGEKVEFDSEKPYSDKDYVSVADTVLDGKTEELKEKGVYSIVAFFIDLFWSIMTKLGLVKFLK